MAVKGKIKPIRDNVLISDMDFDEVRTQTGIFIPNQNGKVGGIKPRWGKVWAIGPDQKDVKVGDWIYVEHGRWTRGIEVEDEAGNEIVVRRVENKSILIIADEKPQDIFIPE